MLHTGHSLCTQLLLRAKWWHWKQTGRIHIPHEVGIAYVVLDQTTTQDDHTRLLCIYCLIVYLSYIWNIVQEKLQLNALNKIWAKHRQGGTAGYIYNQSRVLIRMKVNHISNWAISDGGTKYRNVVLSRDTYNRANGKQRVKHKEKVDIHNGQRRVSKMIALPCMPNSTLNLRC